MCYKIRAGLIESAFECRVVGLEVDSVIVWRQDIYEEIWTFEKVEETHVFYGRV